MAVAGYRSPDNWNTFHHKADETFQRTLWCLGRRFRTMRLGVAKVGVNVLDTRE